MNEQQGRQGPGAVDPKESKADIQDGVPFDLTESLKAAADEGGLRPNDLFLSILFNPEGTVGQGDRRDLILGNGRQLVEWRVESLRSLFRGSRQPPPESDMSRYPAAYVPFFYRVEYNAFRFCRSAGLNPTDQEFLEIYSEMRRRPDGKSLGPLHDTVWQSAALVLGLRPWSEAEYLAVFGQLVRSARRFRMGASSRFYIAYVRGMMDR